MRQIAPIYSVQNQTHQFGSNALERDIKVGLYVNLTCVHLATELYITPISHLKIFPVRLTLVKLVAMRKFDGKEQRQKVNVG